MILASLMAMILLAGCAHVPTSEPGNMSKHGTAQIEQALQEARTEAAALRSNLASTRILTARQEAELRDLRRQIKELQDIINVKHAELIALQNERDRLAQSATVAQVHVADPAVLPPSTDEINAMKTRLHDMETALAALAAELAQVRKEMAPPPQLFLLPPGEKARMRGEDRR